MYYISPTGSVSWKTLNNTIGKLKLRKNRPSGQNNTVNN